MTRAKRTQQVGVVSTAVWFVVALVLLALFVATKPAEGGFVFWGTIAIAGGAMLYVVWIVVQFLRGGGPNAFDVPPHEPQPCPRCGEGARGPSGWCWPCFGVLQQSPMMAGHPLWSDEPSSGLEDLDRAAGIFAPVFTMHPWNGEPIEMTRQNWRRILRMLRRGFPDYRSETEAAFVDPADPAIAWTRSHDRGRRRFGGPPLDLRSVTRFRLEDGLVAEFWIAAPLPVTAAPPP